MHKGIPLSQEHTSRGLQPLLAYENLPHQPRCLVQLQGFLASPFCGVML
jgi:hypothetical protein